MLQGYIICKVSHIISKVIISKITRSPIGTRKSRSICYLGSRKSVGVCLLPDPLTAAVLLLTPWSSAAPSVLT